MNLDKVTWPQARLHEAIFNLGQQCGLSQNTQAEAVPLAANADEQTSARFVRHTAVALGFEADPTTIRYPEMSRFLQTAGPALFRLPAADEPAYLAVLAHKRGQLLLLTPDLNKRKVPLADVRASLCQELEAPLIPEIEELLMTAGVSDGRRAKAQRIILEERLSQARIGGCWLLEASPGSNFRQQVWQARAGRQLAFFLSAHALQYGLLLLSWWVIGQAVFQGRVESAWLAAWALLILSLIPLRLLVTWLQGMIAITAGGLLQKRLLYGALRLHPDEIRHLGIGQMLGRVYESESVESLAVNGGLLGLMAAIELLFSFWILGVAAGSSVHVILLIGWLLFLGAATGMYYRRFRNWAVDRRQLTHDLIEQMVGHRTRLAQSSPDQWHSGEDETLAHYVEISQKMDRIWGLLKSVPAPGWLVLGLVGLVPAFVSGQTQPAALALTIGGILSAMFALQRLSQGLIHLVATAVAWEQIAPLYKAASRPQVVGSPMTLQRTGTNDLPIVSAHEVTYQYPTADTAVLRQCDLNICAGDQILLEGDSGGGKSTLIALLTGLRQPNNGLLLLHGVDRQTMGQEAWRQHITAAPQFHENHVLGNTFVFNLLLSRNWPPQAGDIQKAQALCQELGLGDLLGRMPGGLLQMVGEIGWQLSHGERSRLFVARALLQGADLVVLDESFAALDPQTLQQTMSCVREQASSLLVIAHP